MIKPWLYYITPCILAALIALFFTIIGIVDNSQSGGYSFILVFFFLPALCICIPLDWLVKKFTKGKLLYIWIIEIILMIIGLMCFPSLRVSGC